MIFTNKILWEGWLHAWIAYLVCNVACSKHPLAWTHGENFLCHLSTCNNGTECRQVKCHPPVCCSVTSLIAWQQWAWPLEKHCKSPSLDRSCGAHTSATSCSSLPTRWTTSPPSPKFARPCGRNHVLLKRHASTPSLIFQFQFQ